MSSVVDYFLSKVKTFFFLNCSPKDFFCLGVNDISLSPIYNSPLCTKVRMETFDRGALNAMRGTKKLQEKRFN